MFTNLWRKFRGSRSVAASKRLHVSRKSRRLFLEPLENRSLLATIVVTGIGDSIAVDGVVTLREAITSANNNANVNADVVAVGTYGTDAINFNIPGSGVHTITPTSALPDITDPVTINGYSQPKNDGSGQLAKENTNGPGLGINAVPLIELAGGGPAAPGLSGLFITAGNSTVRGLVINRFHGDGILLASNGNVIAGNFIGTSATGDADLGNTDSGVEITDNIGPVVESSNNTIGGTAPADRNLISGNNQNGVHISVFAQQSVLTGNKVQGNLIGTDKAGTASIGNSGGINLQAFSGGQITGNLIGGTTAAARNVISGNAGSANISVSGSVAGNSIQGNFIGTDVTGTVGLANATNGVNLSTGSSNNTIGGDDAADGVVDGIVGAANVISGHPGGGAGVLIDSGSSGNHVEGNRIGTNAAGTAAIANGSGVALDGGATGNFVGGVTAGAGNVIFSTNVGVSLNGPDNTVQGNFIGTNATGTAGLGGGIGIFIEHFSDTIGGAAPGAGNLISGNAKGILANITGQTTIRGNKIGTDITGTMAIPNSSDGIDLNVGSAPGLAIGGTNPGEGNTIAFNGGSGVRISNGTSVSILGNSIFSNGKLGIDLVGGLGENAFGVTPNDTVDLDTGANNLQNFPELTVAGVVGATLTIEYAVPSTTANSAYPLRVEFFKADADGQEGMTFLGFDTYTAAESTLVKSVSFTPSAAVAVGDRIIATATDAAHNTSEFSAAQLVSAGIDLAAEIAAIPDTATLGENVTIDYAVHNLGNSPVAGSWIDSVYLSTDDLLDASDPLIGRVEHSGGVGAHSSYDETLSALLPVVNEGDYRVFILADSRRLTPDTNRLNNLAASTDLLHVSVPILPLGGTVSGTIADGQDHYFRLDVPPATDVRLAASFSVSSEAEMYVSYGGVPSRDNFDQRVTNLSDLQPNLALSGPAGSYFILLHGREGAGGGAGFELSDKVAGFEITSVSPNRGSNAGQATVTVLGSGFTSDTVVSLTGTGGTQRNAAQVVLRDSNSLFATFDLQGMATGTYDVHIADGARNAAAAGAFTVTSGVAGHVEVGITSTSPMRPFQEGTLTVDYVNAGDTDVPAPLLTIVAENARLRFPDQKSYLGESVQLLGINRDGPAGVLTPGARGRFTLIFLPETFGPHQRSNFTVEIAGPAETPYDLNVLKDSVRPPGIPADAWDAIFANLIARAGNTVGQYQALLDDNATALSRRGQYTPEISRLLGVSIQEADNAYPGLTLANSLDAFAPSPGAVPLLLQRTYLQPISSRYRIGAFGRGWTETWESSASVDPDGNVLIQTYDGFRFFRRQTDGTFLGSFGDPATLTLAADGSHTLREKDGTRFSFRPDGKLIRVADTNGNQITLNYTGGLLTELIHSDGDHFTLEYEQHGRIRQLTDQAGRITTYGYDSSGEHLLSVTGPAGTTAYSYASGVGAAREHALLSVTNPDGSHVFYAYDALGRLIQSRRDGDAELVQYSYGGPGEVTTTDSLGGSTTIRFNDAGQPAQVLDALGRITRFSYDTLNNPVRISAPQGDTLLQRFDPRGNLTALIDPLGDRLDQTFDADLNRLLRFQDALGFSTNYGRDLRGNLTTLRYADGTFESYSVDSRGNIIQFQNRRGQNIFYTYDQRGRLIRKDHADSSHEDFTYDNRGNLLTATDEHGATQFGYDGADRLTRVAYPNGRSLAYTYDAGGRRIRLVDQTGFAVNYSYDAAGRLSALTADGGGAIVSYAYDAVGRLARADKGNGTFTTYAYDAAGQLLHLVNHAPDGAVHSRFDYAYDDLGRPTSMTTLQGTFTYGYDLAERLTSVGLSGGRTIQYAYDAAGNRVSGTDAEVVTDYTTNSLQQYTAVGSAARTYDADGNLIRETVGGQISTFAYDDQNRLTTVVTPAGTWSYEYDALGNRIAAIENGQRTEYLLDPTGIVNVAGEYDAAGSVVARYVHSDFGLVSQLDAGGAAAYYDFDSPGSTVGLTAADGSVLNSYSYLPFGETLSATENIANPFTYIGALGVMAEENGLTFMRNRFYQADVGAFTSIDPLRLLAHGLYQYADNNPSQFVDPQGLKGFMGDVGDLDTTPRTPPGGGPCVDWLGDQIPGCDPLHPPAPKPVPPSDPGCKFINGMAGVTNSPLRNKDGDVIDACHPPTPNKPPPVPGKPGGSSSSEQITPGDPNDITGPAGIGPDGFLVPGLTLPYRINFENKPDASAPAQVVVVTDQLDPDLDFSTFEVGDFGFGTFTIDVPDGLSFFSTRVDARASVGVFVDVTAGIDPATGIVTWTFTSIDPDTLDLVSDPLAGFLPPNVTAPEGDGFVTYFVRSRSGLPTGTRLDAQARIVFDTNDPVDTPAIFNTIDAGLPTSSVDPLAAVIHTESFRLSWSASDDADGSAGSGISLFDVFVSVDGGAFTPFMLGTLATSATFNGQFGHRYGFFSVATDNVGHRQPTPAGAQAFTQLVSASNNHPPHAVADVATLTTGTSVTINVLANDTDPDGDTLTVTAVTQPASGHGTVTINTNGTLTYTQTIFVNGAETFTYAISDGRGGTATATVTVTVNLPASVGIDMLLRQVKGAGLPHGRETSLTAKLNAAQQSLARGNARAVANQLTAFANEVRSLKRSHILAADLADLWLFEHDNILATMPRAAIRYQQMTRYIRTR